MAAVQHVVAFFRGFGGFLQLGADIAHLGEGRQRARDVVHYADGDGKEREFLYVPLPVGIKIAT